jgi:hypothetical protein
MLLPLLLIPTDDGLRGGEGEAEGRKSEEGEVRLTMSKLNAYLFS